MKFRYHLLLCLYLGTLCLLTAQERKVLIIGIDGCRPDALEAATTPALDDLIANGYFSPDALNEDITFSGPGWSAILTGVTSAKHGVTNNAFTGSNFADYPSIFQRVEADDPGRVTASIVHWNPINDQIVMSDADLTSNVATDQAVEDGAVDLLTNNDPDLLFLHFDDVDHAGHGSGFSPTNPSYLAEIEQVDAHVGNVMAALVARPDYANENWLILLTTDHGGLGTSHGGNSIEERRVFFIASGNDIATSVVERTTSVEPVMNCLDETVELHFDGDNDRVNIPEVPAFNFGADRDFTVECRVRTSQAADVAIVGDKNWDSGFFPGFVFSFRLPSGPEWKVNVGDGSNRADLNIDGDIADGQWHTLSVSFDRDGLMRAYEDGVFQGATSIAGIGNINTAAGLFFGADIFNAYDYTGALAEVRIWEGILPAASIQDWHCKPLTAGHPEYADLLGYWPLNETSGTVATDQSGAGNDGTIENAAWQTPPPNVVHDYSATPRLQDIAVTALQHLCIPIDPAWDLDGQTRVMSCAALPVRWEYFTAERQNDRLVELRWGVSREVSNAGFVAEHAVNGTEWTAISPLMSSTADGTYRLPHAAPLKATKSYYRIRQVDHDGTLNYSPIRTVAGQGEQAELSIHPNPAARYVQVSCATAFTAGTPWSMTTEGGKTLLKGVCPASESFQILLDKVPSGHYWLRVEGFAARPISVR